MDMSQMNNMMGMQMMGMASMKENVSIYQLILGFLLMQLVTMLPEMKKIASEYLKKYLKKK